MRRLTHKAWLAGVLLAWWLPATHADISWFNGATNLVYYADGVTPLFGVKGDSSISCFVQLIFAGGDNAIDDAYASGDGTSGDDMVVATGFIGQNLPGTAGSTSHYGRVNGGTFIDDVVGGFYYVRVWTAPSPDFGLGTVPVSTNFYGNSELFVAQAGFEAPSPPQDFNFGGASGFSTTLAPLVPEPSVGFAFVGLLAWLWRRRRETG